MIATKNSTKGTKGKDIEMLNFYSFDITRFCL